tara:strand:+ start:1002 stop:3695 length:2694 start_codon:yes stop_codon:yes gene_type:complete
MKYYVLFINLLFFVNFLLSSNIKLSNAKSQINRNFDSPHIIAIMVQFEKENVNDPLTSGNGNFLTELDIDMIWNSSVDLRCKGFIVDRPPHNKNYFSSQIEALKNYYFSASKGNVDITYEVIENPLDSNGYYTLDNQMRDYSYSDNDLANLLSEALIKAKPEIELYLSSNTDILINDVVFTIFHAGIGQDFTFPTFDPTVYDLKSAFVEPSMFLNLENLPIINNTEISSGILMPETQNMIFYDSIEDIFYGYDDYCDFQLGMTGTYAFLMGYALGLPPLFDTQSGAPGVGIFGLMDYGSNNGRGVIPAFPSPWSRELKSWQTPINMTDSIGFNNLVFDMQTNNIYRLDLSSNEYFLFENHNNKINEQSIDDILQDSTISFWFDKLISRDIFEFSDDSIITKINNYNFGLPESGILIWHINSSIDNYETGINNNRNNRAVSIEEADGALDIGFESYALFSSNNPTNGTKWDMWNLGNEAYFFTNDNNEICLDKNNYSILDYSSEFFCEQNNGNWHKPVIFDKFSNPNSDLIEMIPSFFKFELLDSISNDLIRVRANFSSSLNYIDYEILDDLTIIGTSNESIFYNLDNDVYEFNLFSNDFEIRNDLSSNGEILTNQFNESSTYNTDGCKSAYLFEDEFVCSQNKNYFGYFNDTNHLDTLNLDEFSLDLSDDISIGDIDSDGLDEILWTKDGKIFAANFNGTLVNGFPLISNFSGVCLILENNDGEMVLVSRDSNHIKILNFSGEIISSIPSLSQNDLISIGGYLTDGVRFYEYPTGVNSFWYQRYNNHSHYPASSGTHNPPDYSDVNENILNFYNYPNPITDSETTFRFKVNSNGRVTINIYNLSGYRIDKMTLDNPTLYEYNEIKWNPVQLQSGLYYAEILLNDQKQKIIKIVVNNK